ncbi:MAG: TonB-dependent receptor [Bryobacteraceae bacterium]
MKTSITVVGKVEAESPANITTVPGTQLVDTPGIELDDKLRAIPGFSLFRRSSSLIAQPTTQGVSLRGIGSSGASRTLLLWDGIPANDPFGGWVYWDRFSPLEIQDVEISRGASTSIFGDRALGGAIGVFSKPPEHDRLDASFQGGNDNTFDATLGYSTLLGNWGFSGFGRAFTTDGYYIIQPLIRGTVDRPANLRFATGDARIDYFGGSNRLFLKFDMLAEQRHNGTVLQNNSTGLGEIALHYERQANNETFSILGFREQEDFRSTYSSVTASRNFERLTVDQSVPANGTGAAALWHHHSSRWDLLGGGDFFRAEGFSHDQTPTALTISGGVLHQYGGFAQADANVGPARFFAGARETAAGFGHDFFSPSGGVVVGRKWLRGRATLYRSFRAPTLNELYRNFRVGNTQTLANSGLVPESLFGAEAGFDIIGESYRIRVTGFRDALHDFITNVTLSTTANAITRQRRNTPSALNRGFETEAEKRWRNWRGEVSYLFVDSRFASGLRLPQVPRNQGSATLFFNKGGTMALAGVRSYSSQFEDEINQACPATKSTACFLLPGFATIQIGLEQRLARHLAGTAVVENMLNRQYLAGFTPTPITGTPRLWRVGLRWGL